MATLFETQVKTQDMFTNSSIISVEESDVEVEVEDFFDSVCATNRTNTSTETKDTTDFTNVGLVTGTQEIKLSDKLSDSVVSLADNNKSIEEKTIKSTDVVKVDTVQEKLFTPVKEVINEDIVIVEEDINITEYKGGVVAPREVIEEMAYPCLYLRTNDLPTYKAQTLQALANRGIFDDDSVIYTCYLDYDGTVMQLGYVDNKSLRDFLMCGVFDEFEKTVYLSAEKAITGKYIQALCSA